MLTADTLIRRLLDSQIASDDTIIGCSREEVAILEDCFHTSFPIWYYSFLVSLGKCAGFFLLDAECFYPRVLELTNEASALLRDVEHEHLCLPSGAFVFSFRQREQFSFFAKVNSGWDSTVLHYYEGDSRFERVANSFWDFLESELNTLEEAIDNDPLSPFWAAFAKRGRVKAQAIRDSMGFSA